MIETKDLVRNAEFVMDLHCERSVYSMIAIRHILWCDRSPEARKLAEFCTLIIDNWDYSHDVS